MLRHIEELRKKPKAVRNQYAFSVALTVTLLILAVWAISLPARMSFEEPVVAEVPADEPSFGEQLTEISTYFGQGLEEIKTQAELINVTETLEESPSVTPTEMPVDTAHYDFFPAPTQFESGGPTDLTGDVNQ